MLKDQTFTRPILVAIGHELFFDATNPTQLNLPLLDIAKRTILDIVNVHFVFTDVQMPQGVDDIHFHISQIQGLGIDFANVYLFAANDFKNINAIANIVDIAFAPELFTRKEIVNRLGISTLPPSGFLECLRSAVGSATPFSRQYFRELESHWKLSHRQP